MRKWTVLVFCAVAVLSLSCGFASPAATEVPVPKETPLAPDAKVVRTDIKQTESGELESIEIEVGTTIVWTNRDETILHNVQHFTLERGGTLEFKSDNFAFGEVFQHTFDKVGEFIYFCGVHAVTSKQTITVVEKSGT